MHTILKILKTADRIIDYSLRWIAVICMTVIFLLLIMNVGARYMHIRYFPWWGEIVELCFAWLVFLGAAILWRDNEHFRIDWIMNKIKNPVAAGTYRIVLELLSLFFFSLLFFYSTIHTMRATSWTPVLNFSVRYLIICIPVSSLVLVIYSIRNVLVLFFPGLSTAANKEKQTEQ